MVEVDALHQSSNKHSEQRIFELKQKLEDISQENKSLKREVNTRRYVRDKGGGGGGIEGRGERNYHVCG